MSETPAVGVQRSRRSRAATEHLVGEFIEGGMGRGSSAAYAGYR